MNNQEENRLIATYMGWEFVPESESPAGDDYPPRTIYSHWLSPIKEPIDSNKVFLRAYIPDSELAFHRDTKYLFEVINKIKNSNDIIVNNLNFSLKENYVVLCFKVLKMKSYETKNYIEIIGNGESYTEMLFDVVTKFIQWENKRNTSNDFTLDDKPAGVEI